MLHTTHYIVRIWATRVLCAETRAEPVRLVDVAPAGQVPHHYNLCTTASFRAKEGLLGGERPRLSPALFERSSAVRRASMSRPRLSSFIIISEVAPDFSRAFFSSTLRFEAERRLSFSFCCFSVKPSVKA